jgi:hypothetical protein
LPCPSHICLHHTSASPSSNLCCCI